MQPKPTVTIHKNFLPEDSFKELQAMFLHYNTPWSFNENISSLVEFTGDEKNKDVLFCHPVFDEYQIRSNSFDMIRELFEPRLKRYFTQEFNRFYRIKVNMYMRTPELNEHEPHVDDQSATHLSGGIYCLNTCDGYTGFVEGDIKCPSVANTFYGFNALAKHYSTSTTNAKVRQNINFNWV